MVAPAELLSPTRLGAEAHNSPTVRVRLVMTQQLEEGGPWNFQSSSHPGEEGKSDPHEWDRAGVAEDSL
jgi:hypothetical protein